MNGTIITSAPMTSWRSFCRGVLRNTEYSGFSPLISIKAAVINHNPSRACTILITTSNVELPISHPIKLGIKVINVIITSNRKFLVRMFRDEEMTSLILKLETLIGIVL